MMSSACRGRSTCCSTSSSSCETCDQQQNTVSIARRWESRRGHWEEFHTDAGLTVTVVQCLVLYVREPTLCRCIIHATICTILYLWTLV